MRRMQKTSTEIVTPFDWRRYTALAAGSGRPRKTAARPARKLTVQERIARIMAPRWGNPYCKPGSP